MKKLIKKVTKSVTPKNKDSKVKSDEYVKFKAYMDAYEAEKPEKFASRKAALTAKLNTL